MSGVSTFRLYLLRATYLFIAVGLAVFEWPGILNPSPTLPLMNGVVASVVGAVSLLAVLGVRYPLKMLPLLFFEFLWKAMWVLLFWLRLWSGQSDPATSETLFNTMVGVVLVPLVLPWGYVLKEYVTAPGEPRKQATAVPHPHPATEA